MKALFLAPALLAFLFCLYAGAEAVPERTAPSVQDIFPIDKEKLCPQDKPNCQAKSCMDSCMADGEDEDSCLEECVQYADHSSPSPLYCRK